MNKHTPLEYQHTWLELNGEAICALLGAVAFGLGLGTLVVGGILGAFS
jgi:hypothetical protein